MGFFDKLFGKKEQKKGDFITGAINKEKDDAPIDWSAVGVGDFLTNNYSESYYGKLFSCRIPCRDSAWWSFFILFLKNIPPYWQLYPVGYIIFLEVGYGKQLLQKEN